MATMAQIGAKLFLDVTQYNKGVQSANKNTKGFQKSLGSINKVIGTAIVGSIAVAVASMAKLAQGAIVTGAAFEKSLATVAAVKGFRNINDAASEGGQALAEMETKARSLGKSTAYSATQASDAMIELARAGLSTNDVIGAIGPALFLAGSSAASLTSATSLLASTMKQFDLTAADATRVSDVFTIAQQKSLFAMDSLSEAMKYGGTIGSAFGMSLEETTAALAQFRDLGVEGSQAGTQFRQSMIALANPTGKAKKVLEQFGLTIDDVSPATNSFSEILDTLGKANMSLANVTDLVSKRASGSFVKLIDKFKEGTSTYNELIETFETGGGTAEETYATMIDNVAGRFSILKSAFEELQLTIFDTFSEPLKEVLGTDDDSGMIGLVNTLTDAFQASGHVFKQVFGDIFGSTLSAINSNQIEIASSIGAVAIQVAYLGKTFVDLLPTLMLLGKAVITIFVTGKVIAMANAVTIFTAAISAATVGTTGLRAAMLAAIAASGGLLVVVAGFATLTTIMVSFAMSSSRAAKAQEDLRRSLNASADAQARFNSEMIGGARSGLNSNKVESIELLKGELAAQDALNNVLESQLEKVSALTEKEENAKIVKGQLFQVTLDGEKALIDQATALSLNKTALGEKNDVMQQTLDIQDALNSKEELSKEVFQRSVKAMQDAQDAQRAFNEGKLNATLYTNQVRQALNNFDGDLKTTVRGSSTAADAIEEMGFQIQAIQKSYVLAGNAAEGFNNALAQASATANANAAKDTAEQIREEKKSRKKANEDYVKARKKSAAARLKLEQELSKQLELLRAEDNDLLAVQLQQRIDEVRKVYDEELRFARRNKAKQLEIEQGYQNTISGLLQQATFSQIEQARETAKEIERANIRFGDSERQRLQNELSDKLKEEKDSLESINNAIFVASMERSDRLMAQREKDLITDEQYNDALLQLSQDESAQEQSAQQAFNQKRDALEGQFQNKRQTLNAEIAQTIVDERLAIEQRGVLQELQLRQQADLEILRQRGLSEEEIAVMQEIYRGQRLQAEQGLVDQFVKPYGDYTQRIDDLNKQSTDALTDRAKERADKEIEYLQKRFDLEQRLSSTEIQTEGNEEIQAQALARVRSEMELLDEQYGKSSNSLKGLGERAADTFKKIVSGVGQALKSVIAFSKSAGQAIGQGLESGLSFFTGGAATMNIGGLLQEATNASQEAQKAGQERQQALKQQLESGDITQGEYDQSIKGGLGQVSPAGQAKEFIDELLNNAVSFAQSIAEQAPLIINGLASALPLLIEQLIVSIPLVISALGDGLPVVVFALIDGIIALLPVLADALLNDALPKVIDGIITLLTVKLPELAETLTPIVADLVQFIVEQAPKIVNALTSALPTVIDFLVKGITQILTGIPTLIETLLAAIPVIITELLGGISNLVMVIFQAIPLIIEKVIMALPDIIRALLRGLLGVVVEIASALPMLIAEIINLLPVLLSAILELIPEIIIALVEAIPMIIENLILALPLVIAALINLIPTLIVELIKAIPRLAVVLVMGMIDLLIVQLPRLVLVLGQSLASAIIMSVMAVVETLRDLFNSFPEILEDAIAMFKDLPQKIADGLSSAFDRFIDFFRDVIAEITSLGRAETASFGDTPGAIKAGTSGLSANFAPDDYIIAAQKPVDLLKQAMGAVGQQLPKSLTGMFAKSFPPTMTQPQNASTSNASTTNIQITAEGRLLDDIQVKAIDRGHAPQMERKLKKNRGARIGFDRGRFNAFGK